MNANDEHEWSESAKKAILDHMLGPGYCLGDASLDKTIIRFTYEEGDLWAVASDKSTNSMTVYKVANGKSNVTTLYIGDSALRMIHKATSHVLEEEA